MYHDTECPYCQAGIKINHDDGQGYEEDTFHQQQCPKCGKYFVFTRQITYTYETQKADCLNDDKHDWKLTNTYPQCFSKMECTICGERRELTDEEKATHGITSPKDYFNSLKTPQK